MNSEEKDPDFLKTNKKKHFKFKFFEDVLKTNKKTILSLSRFSFHYFKFYLEPEPGLRLDRLHNTGNKEVIVETFWNFFY